MINAKVPFLYSREAPGFILSESISIRCSFPRDGATMSKICAEDEDEEDCRPGCFTRGIGCKNSGLSCYDSIQDMMETHERVHPASNICVPKGQHDPLNTCQYNEVVLDSSTKRWKAKLPRIIDAVFFPAGKGENYAREIHTDFLREFKLTALQVPLIKLEREEGQRSPFVLMHTDHDTDSTPST